MAHKSKKSRARRTAQEQGGAALCVRGMLTGSMAGTLVFFALLCLLGLVTLKSGMRQATMPYLGIASGAVSAFIAGLIAVKRIGKNGLVMGGISVLPLMALVLLTVLFTGKTLGLMAVVLVFTMLVTSCVGGILAVNRGRR